MKAHVPFPSVITLYADIVRSKTEWCNTKFSTAASGLLLDHGIKLSEKVTATRAANLDEVALKLADALEWLHNAAVLGFKTHVTF